MKGLTDDPNFDTSTCPSIDEDALSPALAKNFSDRKRAVILYLEGKAGRALIYGFLI